MTMELMTLEAEGGGEVRALTWDGRTSGTGSTPSLRKRTLSGDLEDLTVRQCLIRLALL